MHFSLHARNCTTYTQNITHFIPYRTIPIPYNKSQEMKHKRIMTTLHTTYHITRRATYTSQPVDGFVLPQALTQTYVRYRRERVLFRVMGTTEPPEIASCKQSIDNVPHGIKTYVESNGKHRAAHLLCLKETNIVSHGSEKIPLME